MWLIHRTLLIRLLVNFMLLFACLYLFATTIDVVLNLDAFATIAEAMEGSDAPWWRRLWRTLMVTLDYQWPQIFQYYAFLHGLVAIAALGFTCTSMARSREFVAIAAAGVSLRRLAGPVVLMAVVLGGVQIVNQEFILPKVSGLLLRKHAQAGKAAIDAFRVPFTADSDGTLLQAAAFKPDSERLEHPTFLHRDAAGRTTRRVWAQEASWDSSRGGWQLDQGLSASTDAADAGVGLRTTETFEPSTLSPRRLLIRRRGEYAGMMGAGTLLELNHGTAPDDAAPLRRALMARLVMPLVNVLCLLIAMPFFVDRLPGGLLLKSVLCCGIVLPLYMVAAGVQVVSIPGIGPLAGVVLPLVLLIPLAVWRLGRLQT